jgi:hypothetical protein
LLNASFIKVIFEIIPHIEQKYFVFTNTNENFLSVTLHKTFFTSELNSFFIYFKELPKINISFVFNTRTSNELRFLLTSYKINTKMSLKQ